MRRDDCGGEEEREHGNQESGEPRTPTLPTGRAPAKPGDMDDHLDQEDQPKERQHHEQNPKQRPVHVSGGAAPLGEHDVGEKHEVQRHGRTLQGCDDAL